MIIFWGDQILKKNYIKLCITSGCVCPLIKLITISNGFGLTFSLLICTPNKHYILYNFTSAK